MFWKIPNYPRMNHIEGRETQRLLFLVLFLFFFCMFFFGGGIIHTPFANREVEVSHEVGPVSIFLTRM